MSDGEKRRVEVTVAGPSHRLATPTEFHLLRIGQEAVTNAVKHGDAHRITVALDYAAGGVTLRVSDDGRGFDSAAPPARPGAHFGLMGMHERAAKIGALLAIESQPGAGASVRCILLAPDNSPA